MINLSVIVPIYNVENYLQECIESLINQSYSNYELILVDDGSTDNSYEIALTYKKKYPKLISLYKQVNKGQAAARNFGLSRAKGKYISFVDSDDFIDKDMYSILINEAEENTLDIAQCSYLNWFSTDSKKNFPYRIKNITSKVYNGKDYFELNPSLSPCDKIYLRSFLIEIDFQYEEGRYAEDVLAMAVVFFYARRVKYCNNILYYYRRLSINSTRNSKNIEKVIKLNRDKLYIANKLNVFKNEHEWDGNVRRIIFRNVIGVFLKKHIFNYKYLTTILGEAINNRSIVLLFQNFKATDTLETIKIGVNKIILKKDV